MIRVLYLHGMGARPGGLKVQFLRAQGFDIDNPHLPDHDFVESVRRADTCLQARRPDVIVGSSRGGAVAMNLRSDGIPLVLVCPAWRGCGVSGLVPQGTIVLHSPHDSIVPFSDSEQLLRHGLAPGDLISVGADHFMNDPAAQQALADAVRRQAAVTAQLATTVAPPPAAETPHRRTDGS